MFYKLLGMLTWKAIRYYVRHKVPRGTVAAVAVVVGIVVIAAVARLRDADEA